MKQKEITLCNVSHENEGIFLKVDTTVIKIKQFS